MTIWGAASLLFTECGCIINRMEKEKNPSFTLFLALTAVLIGGSVGFLLFSVWDLPEVRTLEDFKPSITSRVYSDSNKLLEEFFVENRTPVVLSDVPPQLIDALIATEDTRFYTHHGMDFRGIARALYRNIRAGRIVEGGSTLTQQLAKVLFLTPERSYSRKLKEMVLALKIEQQYTKKEILSLYLNQIYFGSGAYGVESAARIYFSKSVKQLELAECALLAGLPRSPKYYSPFKDPDNALGRRAYVLNRMAKLGYITEGEAGEAKKLPLPVQPKISAGGPAPYFVEYIRQKVEERFGSSILYSGGLNIYTSINDRLQQYAQEAITAGLARVEARRGKKRKSLPPLQAALIAIDPSTGHIQAMVGGRDFNQSQFNRAWQAVRQPGSSFKPIIYAAALERGFGSADLLEDAPVTYKVDNNKTWKPENFSKRYRGMVTMRRALEQSINIPAIRLLEKIGVDETIQYTRRLGLTRQLGPYLSLALGSSDLTLLELTSIYAVFANYGIRMEPAAILMITDSTDRIVYSNESVPRQVMRPETAYLITNLLTGVVERGTGRRARRLKRPVAGKTGTTNDYRDAWFIGYAPSMVAGVWVGYDDHRSIGPRETGARAALPIWIPFMRKAHAGIESENFTVPESIIFKQIDPATGLLSSGNCKESIREAFLPGTEPRRYCEEAASLPEESPPR